MGSSDAQEVAGAAGLRAALLDWYAPRRRAYPWRRGRPDPYAVLVSEVMLQQTQAARVAPAFEAFLARFPDVGLLATASRDEVVRAWAGLGYNRRAVALHEAARAIVSAHDGRVPGEIAALRALPGVGPYTAAAVVSFAFGAPVAAIDTNVRRIVARVFWGREPDEVPTSELTRAADDWIDPRRSADQNQALMDLGRQACRPRPRCDGCPLSDGCRFARAGRRGRSSARRQPPFEGSPRQARGRVVAALRTAAWSTPRSLAEATGLGAERVATALAALEGEGLVERTASGRVRLSRG